MPFPDPFGYNKQFAALSGQLSQILSVVKQTNQTESKMAQGLTDLQAQVSALVAATSNEVAAVNAAIVSINNAVAVLQNPSSDDAAEEAASQTIATQVAAIQASMGTLGTAVGALPPVSQIPNTPAPAPAPAAS